MTVAIPGPRGAAEVAAQLVAATPDVATVRLVRTALTLWLIEQAIEACPWTHHPVDRHDGRTPWCVYCGCDEVGQLIVDPTTVRGLAS